MLFSCLLGVIHGLEWLYGCDDLSKYFNHRGDEDDH